ncbi:protein BONZAI 3-like [Cornus florida]|uniref:protein BONZAI 3-like n=1 Tax=Cornus florida TaxID=4283 RepID=UPI00289939D6|nr:protein BONZAI 3-like [Cornus florida]XP_059664322.1 protein BONZAI 3-like [Cornus florida]
MGMCFSYLRGGQQAVGGGAVLKMNDVGGGAAHNDAVDKFFRTKGPQALFTQIELSLSASKLRDRDIISKVQESKLRSSLCLDGLWTWRLPFL